ncbi:MAG: hypothetical protein P9L99_19835 [Candidatus Lernaella stagnicola]|nr:hypothetical protein [Candidatus Lernaella stagnicola]
MDRNTVQTVHAEYREHVSLWELWRNAYFGGRAYVQRALESHRLENARDFSRRLSRATLLNYVRPICDTYANYLFRPAWELRVPPMGRALLRDADRRGTSLLDFMKGLMPLTAAVGFCVIGIDEPPMPDGTVPRNKAARDALGVRPYLYYVAPMDLLNWQADADGRFTFALVRESRWPGTGSPGRGGRPETGVYRAWTPDECTVVDGNGEVLARYENRTGEVPLVSLQYRDVGDPVIGQGLGQDLEPVQAHILNVASLLSEIFFRQTFSQLVAEGSAEEYGEQGDISRLGTASIFLYPEGRSASQYISPDATQAELLMSEIDRSIDEIYRLANLTRGSVREGRQQSGISKAFDFLDTNQALADVGRNVASAATNALRIAGLWAGWPTDEIVVRPPVDYGIVDLDGDIDRLKALVDAGADESLVKAIQERIAATMFPDHTKASSGKGAR